MVAWSFFGIGELIASIIILVIMPELQKDKLQMYLLILSVFPLLQFISCLLFLNDSPKGLLLTKKIRESFSIEELDRMNSINVDEE